MVQYRILGRTGLKVSVLGFGAMRLPMKDGLVDREKAVPMIHRAFDAGVNYIDSAVFYCNDDSQRAVGEALKGRRDGIVVSTKNHFYDKKDKKAWWTNLENSLERLQVQTIDIYNHHGLNWKAFCEQVDGPDGLYREMLKAKDQGLITRICFSFHDSCENLIKLVDTGMFESVTCQYNLLDRSNEAGIAHAHEKGMGVVIMGPVGGGRLGETGGTLGQKLPPGAASTPELALRFVMANPNVTIALSGMSTMEQVTENVAVADSAGPLTPEQMAAVDELMGQLKAMADLYCTGCGYCKPCPNGVAIPDIFRLVNQYRVYGAKASAIDHYRRLIKHQKDDSRPADACVECGKCEEKCPQHIKIMEQLKQAHELLTVK
ncbi:MAG TPA: aldo/keto reductase [Planctomycetota bacterium]|nr:aldo/keto reductase [Planctomycetota bacterium]